MSDSQARDRDMDRAELVDALRRMRPALAGLGVNRLALVGSRARGDNRAESDVDLLVDIEHDRKFSLLDLIGVQHAVEDDIGLRANVFMRRSLEAEFVGSIRKDEVVIFGA